MWSICITTREETTTGLSFLWKQCLFDWNIFTYFHYPAVTFGIFEGSPVV